MGLATILGGRSYAEVNVSRDFLGNLSSCWERFVESTDDVKYVLVVAIEEDKRYSTSYGLETETIQDIGHSYKLTRLKKGQPLTVRISDTTDLSRAMIALTDTDLDGIVDDLLLEKVYELGATQKIPIKFSELSESEKAHNQNQYERALRALTRKMDV